MPQLIDHLWQSVLFAALTWLLTALTRSNAAALRLWMWRIAALKFLLPFALLHALGGWLGFPVRHSAIPPPAWLTETLAVALRWVSPAQSFATDRLTYAAGLATMLALAALCASMITRQIRISLGQRAEEVRRVETNWRDAPPSLGFLQTFTLASTALMMITGPALAGALRDRLDRQAALAVDIAALRTARIDLAETAWRFGDRTQVVATGDGVLIRRVNLQDLVALVYGIGQFEVFGGALPWLESPHYDVHVVGPVHAPEMFDPYALRQPVTDYLNHEFGVSIRVNGRCQDPCLNQESFIVERVPWTLLDSISKKTPPPGH